MTIPAIRILSHNTTTVEACSPDDEELKEPEIIDKQVVDAECLSSANSMSASSSEDSKDFDYADEKDDSEFEVKWDGQDDQEDVRRWSLLHKWILVFILTIACTNMTALSSAWAMATPDIARDLHISIEVAELGLSFYLLGLCVGPLFLAPLSEIYGRQPMYIVGLVMFFAFQFCSAFANNIATSLIGRFFVSMGGSVFMSNVPGTFSDIFTNQKDLGLAMSLFTLGPFLGPGIGPTMSGFIVQHANYKWIFYTFIIWSFVEVSMIFTFVPETYTPVLLRRKARRLRKETQDDRFYAPMERMNKSVVRLVSTSCTRPIKLLFTEPMLLLLCFYTGFLIMIIYLFLVAFPMVYEQIYHFEVQYVGLSFVSIIIGMLLGASTFPFWSRLHEKQVAKNNGKSLPEFRLPQMCAGSILTPIGLFIYAWTVYPSVPWIASIIGSTIFGVGCYMTLNSILVYTVEAYRTYAASATAANVFLRCFMSASAPLFGVQMLDAMGFHWGISLLAFVACALCPSAFILYWYGEAIRRKSKNAYF